MSPTGFGHLATLKIVKLCFDSVQCHYFGIWIKSTLVKMLVLNLFELAVRQNLQFFYQCRRYILLFAKLNMNNQTIINFTYALSRVLILFIGQDSVRVYGAELESKGSLVRFPVEKYTRLRNILIVYFHFELFACFPFLMAPQYPYQWNQAWYSSGGI